MSTIFYSPDGNPELWDEKPDGYYTEQEYSKLQDKVNSSILPDNRIEKQYWDLEDIATIKKNMLSIIDIRTSNIITNGFYHTMNNQRLFFSYDSHDQQNFSDTANVCLLKLSGEKESESLPNSVKWNAYIPNEVTEYESAAKKKGALVILELTIPEFLDLYLNGALQHKQTEIGLSQEIKDLIYGASTKDELFGYAKDFRINLTEYYRNFNVQREANN